jgi:hypothetical protein
MSASSNPTLTLFISDRAEAKLAETVLLPTPQYSFSSQFFWVGKSGVALSFGNPDFPTPEGKGRQFRFSDENKLCR